MTKRFGLVIHGGAGNMSKEEKDRLRIDTELVKILNKGMVILDDKSGTATTAVEYVVSLMEDSGIFNAGRGSCLTQSKSIEMDAGIMDGDSLRCGGVAMVKNFANPIKIARKIMDNTPYSLLAGTGVTKFAISQGFEEENVEPTENNLKKFYKLLKKNTGDKFGTVGSVAIDKNGNLAAAVSTGGIWLKHDGRIGDSAIVGAGYYANKITAVVATGNGAAIMKENISKRICELVTSGIDIVSACDQTIKELEQFDNGKGGVIAVNNNGQIGISYNTESMTRGYLFNDMNSPNIEID